MENDDTMVMDTVKINILQGIVHGVVESDFQKLSEKITPILQKVWWDKDRLFVSNRGSEQFFGDYHKLFGLDDIRLSYFGIPRVGGRENIIKSPYQWNLPVIYCMIKYEGIIM